jgi:putative phosphoserine phosphatase / 1-acylglycerol-3-phosphate O-acyltransferase
MITLHNLPADGVDFFDVDHTIVDSSTSLQFLITGIQHGHFSIKTLACVPGFLFQYYFGMSDLFNIRRRLFGFEGFTEDELFELGKINFKNNIHNRIFPQCEELIASLSAKGRKTCLVTSSFKHVVQPLADFFKIDYVLSNSMVFEDGITTGEFIPPFLFGIEKRNRASALLDELNISPQNCSFFTDSYNDISLLSLVGHPIAVNPDNKLTIYANDKSWTILRFFL